MYKDSTLQIKVNGHTGKAFHPTNAVAQGSPLSPLLYLLVIQSFVSLLNVSHRISENDVGISGINVPGPGGDAGCPQAVRVLAFADDLVVFLRNADELPAFRELLRIYETGAGAKNSWAKTHGLRVGSLRGSTHLPQGWQEGRDINTKDAIIRYLGIFLGASEDVARKWEAKVTAKMEARFNRWVGKGAPATRTGRNIVIRNSCFALAWFMVAHQYTPQLKDMMNAWSAMGWKFFEMSMRAGDMDGTGHSGIERHTLIADYAEGGQRCQDVELFSKSLYIRQVGRIVAPSTHRGADLVMGWINEKYGHLRMGKRLLVSSCDFLELPDTMPPYWRIALTSWGALRGLVPSAKQTTTHTPEVTYRQAREGRTRVVHVDGDWSLPRVLVEPIFYNPHLSGWWGASVLDPPRYELDHRLGKSKAHFLRHSAERVDDAKEVYERSRRFAALGITHVCHLLTPHGRLLSWEKLTRLVGRRGERPCSREEFEALISSLPRRWKNVLDAAAGWIAQRGGRSMSDAVGEWEVPASAWLWVPKGEKRLVVSAKPEASDVYEWLSSGELRLTTNGDRDTPNAEELR